MSAEVAGLVEAVRWVLSWRRNAEALGPEALRGAVAEELREALRGYGDGEVRSCKASGGGGETGSTGRPGRVGSAGRFEGTS